KHALWGVSHWGQKRQQFYGFAVNRESALYVYSKRRIIAVTDLKIVEWRNYKHLDWISKRLNLTKPDTYRSDLNRHEAYTAYSNPSGFIYQNKDKKNKLMRIDELYKFSDGTLNDVRNALDDRLKEIRMQYLPQAIWRKGDKDRAVAMIQSIDKMLKIRRIMRSLERFVGGRLAGGIYPGISTVQPPLAKLRTYMMREPIKNQNRNNQNQNFQNQNRNQGNHHPQRNNQGRNQFFQGASHDPNPPPAYQAPGYQASVHQPQIPQPQVMTTNEFTNFMMANDAIFKNMQTNMTSLTNSNLELKNMFA
nr:hypothetical protein [Tanacetum cinerariifolium]